MDLEEICIDFDWMPGATGSGDTLVLGCSDGSFLLTNQAKRVEKKISEAHNGAIISIKWNYEGTDLATGGEDGQIKVSTIIC